MRRVCFVLSGLLNPWLKSIVWKRQYKVGMVRRNRNVWTYCLCGNKNRLKYLEYNFVTNAIHELHQNSIRTLTYTSKISRLEGDSHGKHERCKSSSKIICCEPVERWWWFQGNSCKENSPDGEQSCRQGSSLCVSFECFLSECLFFSGSSSCLK